ncbi:CapA family protein [Tenacibaculum jejuense]|uniref:Probable lipoprotein. Capsule biosynthesis-related protein n=1 Tax=Tenacibaculum jejuense TaxID=584609 RepID=A0A238UB41_9FLAO|nr:CapA family protein [Tenacibaculum jejuense]SNR16423.1 Probable lipoprotein precursor. Capsule biosynthesis-related protein [Tenacibaculum jejuense]
MKNLKILISILVLSLIYTCATKKTVQKQTTETKTEIEEQTKEEKVVVEEVKKEEKKKELPKKVKVLKKDDEISLLFIGDFMGHMDQIKAAYNKKTKTYEYDSCFSKIKPILSNADVTLGNLEVTLGVKPYSGYPQFSSPPSYASAIKNAGVDILTTSNNHSCDKRKKGVERTIHILDSLNIGHTGTFINAIEKTKNPAYVIRKNNFEIAVISYTYGTNGLKPTAPNVVNYLKKETIKKDVNYINSSINPDQIIAFVHWGDQYKDLPNKSQKDMFTYFKSLGVNIVIGAHPHVLQPMEWHKVTKENEKESLVVYSLGNFVSHQRTFPRDGGAVFKLWLKKGKDNKVKIKKADYFLTWVHEPVVNGNKEYYVLPADTYSSKPESFTKKKDYDKMMRYIKHARKLLGEHNKNINEYTK